MSNILFTPFRWFLWYYSYYIIHFLWKRCWVFSSIWRGSIPLKCLAYKNISFFAWPYIFWFINNSSGKCNCCHAWRKRLRRNVYLYPWSMIYCSLVTPFLGSTFFSNLQFITFNAWRVILFKSSILSYNDTFFLKYILRNSLPLKSGHEVTLKQILHILRTTFS